MPDDGNSGESPRDGYTVAGEEVILGAMLRVDAELAEHGSLVPVMRLHGADGDDAMRMAVVRALRIAQSSGVPTDPPSPPSQPSGDAPDSIPASVREAVPVLASQWILGCAVALAVWPPQTGVGTAALATAARRIDGSVAMDGARPLSLDAVDVEVVRNVGSDRAAAVIAAQRAAGGGGDTAIAAGLAAAFVDGFMIGFGAATSSRADNEGDADND